MPKHLPAVPVEYVLLAMQHSGYAWIHTTTPNHAIGAFLSGEGKAYRGKRVTVMAIGDGYALAVYPETATAYTTALFTVSVHPVVIQDNGDWIPTAH